MKCILRFGKRKKKKANPLKTESVNLSSVPFSQDYMIPTSSPMLGWKTVACSPIWTFSLTPTPHPQGSLLLSGESLACLPDRVLTWDIGGVDFEYSGDEYKCEGRKGVCFGGRVKFPGWGAPPGQEEGSRLGDRDL